MTPLQQLRLWLRRAPWSERAAVACACLLVLGLLGTVAPRELPGSESVSAVDVAVAGGSGDAPAGALRGDPAAPVDSTRSGSGEESNAVAGGALPVSAGGQAGVRRTRAGQAVNAAQVQRAAGSRGTRCPASSAPGVSDKEIKLAVLLVDIAGPAGNGVFGVSSAERQQQFYQAAIDEVNARGGVACRKLVARFYNGNPADQNDLRAKCFEMAESGAFAVLDAGIYAQFPLVRCYADAKIPYFSSYFMSRELQRTGYPYLFAFQRTDIVYKDTVFALRDRGFFRPSNGMKKLGFIYRSCEPELLRDFRGWLTTAGVQPNQLSTYDVGCPTALASPSDIQQAILKFKRDGVTHLTSLSFMGDFASFTNAAEQQQFRPRYGIADDAVVALSYGSSRPNPDNTNGAIVIAGSRVGENRTPGSVPTAGTKRCDAAFQKAGLPTTYASPSDAGNACSNLWMFVAAAQNARALDREALADGLRAAGSVEMSYPIGPNTFAAPRTTTGGQFWRPLQYRKACGCWQVVDPRFRPTYG